MSFDERDQESSEALPWCCSVYPVLKAQSRHLSSVLRCDVCYASQLEQDL